MSVWPWPIAASAMNSEFALDPATEDVIRFLRTVIAALALSLDSFGPSHPLL